MAEAGGSIVAPVCALPASGARQAALPSASPPRLARTAGPLPPGPPPCRLQVEVWGPLAERVEQELQKGDRLAVQVGLLAVWA